MKKLWSIICVLFGMTVIAGCSYQPITGNVIEKEYEQGGSEYNYSKNKWEYEPECYELDIVDEGGYERELCVSERVWQDAMEGHQITLTEEYH